MKIKKYVCKVHKYTSTRKGMREHLGEAHTRNKFKNLEVVDGKGTWFREVFE